MKSQRSPKVGSEGLNQLELQAILHQNAKRLLAYVSSHMQERLRHILEPEDLLQEVFLEAFLRIGEFQSKGHDATYRWLVTIARHRIGYSMRAANAIKRGKPPEASSGLKPVIDLVEQLATYNRTPSQSAMSHEVVKVVQQSLSRIRPIYRDVIQYRYLDGLSIINTAKQMQTTEDTITTLCYRGLQELKTKLLSYVSAT